MKFRVLLLAAVLCVSGCLGKTPPSTLYLMQSLPEIQPQNTAFNQQAPIGLGPVDFPEYADRPQLVLRRDQVQIAVNDFHRWASPINGHFSQVLAEDLSWHLKGRRVLTYPWRHDQKPAQAVRLRVLQFEGDMERFATLTVEWELYETAKDRVLYSERQKWVMPLREGDYYHAFILGMSENVAQLAKRIAGRIAD